MVRMSAETSCGLAIHRPLFPRGAAARSPECSAPCAKSSRPYVLAATILGSSMAFIDGAVVNIALPAIQRALGVDFDVLQWIVNAYTLMLGALILAGGALGDRYGRRRIFVLGIVLFALASVACALAVSAAMLIAARALQGLGAALLVPQSLAIIAASFPKDVRGKAIGTWAAVAALTTAAGPLVGGVLIDLLSWRAVFWINVPLAILAVLLAWRHVPESHGEVTGPLDYRGGLLVTLGLVLVTYALTAVPDRGFADALVVSTFIAGCVLLVASVRVELRAALPLVPLRVFRSPVFSATNLITLCLYFALSAVLLLLPYMLIQIRGYSELAAGAALLPFGLIMGVFSPRAGAVSDRFGPRWPLTVGSVLVAAACVGLVLVENLQQPGYFTAYLPAVALLAIGMTIVVAPLTTAVMNAVDERDTGAASGINNAVSRIAGAIAVAIAGLAVTLVFSHALEASLTAAGIDTQLLSVLMAGASKLAALQPPEGTTLEAAAQIRTSIASAFASGYRAGIVVAAGAASLAAVLSLLYLRPARKT